MRARILQAEWAGCFYCKQSILRRQEYLIVITGEEAGEGGSICITSIYHNPMYTLMTVRGLRDKHVYYNSVRFSRPVVSDSATPWIPAHQASLSTTNSQSSLRLMSIESVMPSSHLSSVVLFSSCPQSFPASGYFQMSQLFASHGQSIGVSASASVVPMNIQDWFL